MGTIATNLLPNATGLDLGNPSQRFDVFAKDLTADALTSNSPNPATTGEINLASTDTIAWRNAANSADVLLSKSQGAGALPADTLQWPNGISSAEYITATANPSATGVVRLANVDAINFRNNGNSADLNGISANADNSMDIGDTIGIHTGPVLAAGDVTVTGGGAFHSAAGTNSVLTPLGTSGDSVNITATNGTGVSGGAVTITAGNGTGANGGLVTITGGNSTTSAIGGNVVLVPGTGASAQGSCVLNGDVHITKTITSYNGLTTTGNGTPAIVATVDLTAQTAASGATLYTTSAAGQYELTWNAKVNTAATGAATSTLGPFTLLYIDADGVTVTTTGQAAQSSAGAIITTNATNSTTSTGIMQGIPVMLNCFNPTNIIWAMAYASNTANTMAYSIHIKLKFLG